MYQLAVTGVFLFVCACTDLRERCVDKRFAGAALALAAAGHLAAGEFRAGWIALSLLPGACCFLLSFLTREELGYGDGLAVVVCGLSLGIARVTELLLAGFFLAFLWAVGLCLFWKAGRKKEFPLMPFFFAAFVILLAEGF